MKTTIHHFEASDRLTIITYEGSEIIGINYIQGSQIDSDLPIDQLLTAYVLKRLDHNLIRYEQLEQIDKLIWNYAEREVLINESTYRINQTIDEMVQENADSGNVSPSQSIELDQLTNKLSELVAEIVVQNQ